jgi:tRNA threonylcarbamoyladenosine biosynthesis protein TsaB
MKSDRNETMHYGAGTGKVLAIDTSTTSMSVALLEDGRLRKEVNSFAERNHSIYLLTNVQEALLELSWSSRDLQGIVVGRGPGSYTGVRIGITAAKTMAWAMNLPVAGVSSLEAMAGGGLVRWNGTSEAGDGERRLNGPEGSVWIIPMMNARRGQAFTALFGLDDAAGGSVGGTTLTDGGLEAAALYRSGWTRKHQDGIRLMEQWTQQLLEDIRLSEKPPGSVLFTGETADFADVIERFTLEAEGLGSPAIRTFVQPYGIQAQYIGYLGEQRLAAGDSDDVHGLLPNYTQLPEAEVNLLAQKKQ